MYVRLGHGVQLGGGLCTCLENGGMISPACFFSPHLANLSLDAYQRIVRLPDHGAIPPRCTNLLLFRPCPRYLRLSS